MYARYTYCTIPAHCIQHKRQRENSFRTTHRETDIQIYFYVFIVLCAVCAASVRIRSKWQCVKKKFEINRPHTTFIVHGSSCLHLTNENDILGYNSSHVSHAQCTHNERWTRTTHYNWILNETILLCVSHRQQTNTRQLCELSNEYRPFIQLLPFSGGLEWIGTTARARRAVFINFISDFHVSMCSTCDQFVVESTFSIQREIL